MRIAFCLILPLVFFPQIVPAQQARAAGQFPSPMQENVRAHRRIQQKSFDGEQFVIDSILPKAIQVYIPARVRKKGSADILFHFHGNTNVVDYAADHYHGRLVAVSINLGSGSSVYARPFSDTGLFKRLLDTVTILVALKLHHRFHGRRVILSGFSAGYGAVRKIISNPSDFDRVDRILLLDGLHADYIPSNVVLADGGVIDSVQYRDFVRFCSIAAKRRSTKKFLFTTTCLYAAKKLSDQLSMG